VIRGFVGDDVLPRRVLFTHPKPAYHAEYTRLFRGAECFTQELTGLELERTWLDRTAATRPSELHGYLVTRAELLLAKVDRDSSATERVTRWLDSQTELTRPTLSLVARELGASTRSLRRRLRHESTHFGALVDDARAAHAKRMLQDPSYAIQDAAYALGFRAPSAFSRAFKRWTGMSPKAYRKANPASR
jgi:AraC-like DNA-binding protein